MENIQYFNESFSLEHFDLNFSQDYPSIFIPFDDDLFCNVFILLSFLKIINFFHNIYSQFLIIVSLFLNNFSH